MPIQPLPFKYICRKCKYKRIVKPKNDKVNFIDMVSICPKCKNSMQRQKLNLLENVKYIFS